MLIRHVVTRIELAIVFLPDLQSSQTLGNILLILTVQMSVPSARERNQSHGRCG